MDKETILLTVWVTIWNANQKKLERKVIEKFAGHNYLDALSHVNKKATKLGWKMKIGRKYISLTK